MLTLAKNRIQPKAIAAIVASLVGGTYIIDRIIAFIIRPYLQEFYDARMVKKTVPLNAGEIYHVAVMVQGYHLVVFHFLVLIATLLVFFRMKFKPYRRELLLAYIIIAIARIAWVFIYRFLINPA